MLGTVFRFRFRYSNIVNFPITIKLAAIIVIAIYRLPRCDGEAAVNQITAELKTVFKIPSGLVNRSINGRPDGVDDTEVTFYLFTNANEETARVLRLGDSRGLIESRFNPEWETKIFIHGWTGSAELYWYATYRDNYFAVGNYNLVFVDWSSGASKGYLTSAKSTRPVGEKVGKFIDHLQRITNASLSRFHILGHSLGAHVAGFAGSYLSGRVGRITGMDPAAPAFELPLIAKPNDRLDPTDARFVDVIHTCAGTLGFVSPIGDADFYPNGGSFPQPGCPPITSQYCSHERSHRFMAESVIRTKGFPAVRCGSWGEFVSGNCEDGDESETFMGENVSQDVRGKYYLRTNPEQPFGTND